MASRAMRTTPFMSLDFFDGDNFAAFVVSALRADPVRQLGLVTLRARRRRLRFEEVVRAARAGAGLGMAAFWIWHRSTPGLNVFLLRQLLPDVLQRAPALVDDRALTRACLPVPIRAALCAEAETALLTQRLHRNRELNLLRRKLLQRNRPLRVKLHVELVRGDLDVLILFGCFRTRREC